jgi:hypothetical protein
MSDWNAELTEKQLLEDQNGLLQMLLIQEMRVYDVMLTLLRNVDSEAAEVLLDRHKQFKYIGPLPYTEE